MREQIRKLIHEVLLEFKEDIGKQCIVLMGLPAAGKSTFINNEIGRYIAGFSGYNVSASDVQVMAAQYQHGKNQYEWMLKNINDEADLKTFIENSKYINNNGQEVRMPITMEWWITNKGKGLKAFYTTFYKSFYATYFDIRDYAQQKSADMFATKIVTAGNFLVIDTTAAKSSKIIQQLQKTRENGFHNTIIYLDIDPNLSIQRDEWRQKTQGRGVGAGAIFGYAKQMGNAYNVYVSEGKKGDGVVDRLMHFQWKPAGNSPIKGAWILKKDDRFSLKRRLQTLKQK